MIKKVLQLKEGYVKGWNWKTVCFGDGVTNITYTKSIENADDFTDREHLLSHFKEFDPILVVVDIVTSVTIKSKTKL